MMFIVAIYFESVYVEPMTETSKFTRFFNEVWQSDVTGPVVPCSLSHPLMEVRASPASTSPVVVSFTPAAVVASSASPSVFTAKTVAVVSTAAASFPAASPASERSTLHYCQQRTECLVRDTVHFRERVFCRTVSDGKMVLD